jgi:plastocyanin
MATLNFPDAPSTGDVYKDGNSGFSYEWNGTVWISTDPSTAANIREIDDISSDFDGSDTTFTLKVSGVNVEPVNAQQLIVSVGGVMQNAGQDFTVSGAVITFTTAPSSGLTFFGVLLGTALSLNTIPEGGVTPASLTTTSNYVMNGLTLDQGAGIITAFGFQGGSITADLDSTFAANVSIAGSLTVQGTQTIINTDELNVQDKTIGIGSTNAPSSTTQDGAGAIIYGQTHIDILYDRDKAALGISTAVSVTGFVTATGALKAGTGSTITGVLYAESFSGALASWTLGASGTDHYTFDGPGLTGAESDPTLYLQRGKRYNFVNSSGGHPFRIQSDPNGSSGTAYNDGVTNNDAGDGTTLEWDVQFDAPNVLYYQCTSHANMGGKIYIGNSGDSAIIGTGVTINNTGIDAGIGAGIVTASSFVGGGANITALSGSNIASGTVAAARVATLNQNTTGTSAGLTGTPNIDCGTGSFTGDVDIAASLVHTGDTDTKLTFGTNTIKFDTNSSERVRITSSGDVGIGTNSPTRGPLHIHENSDSDCQIHLTNQDTGVTSSDGMTIFTDTDTSGIWSRENVDFRIATNAIERFRIESGGGVVIGDGATYSASGNLHVVGDSNSNGPEVYLQVNNNNTTDNIGALLWGNNTDKSLLKIQGNTHTSNTTADLSFHTSSAGTMAERLKITSTGGFQFSNGLFDEKCNITAGKLSDNQDIDLADGMVHYFSTQESTTATPNIRIDGSTTLQSAMDTGDVCSVTLITTAAAAGYSANLTIDGNAVTEEWVGGAAPAAGSADGLDIYTYTIICIGTGTGDSGFKVIGNLTNATN